jgi:hypothetical protein
MRRNWAGGEPRERGRRSTLAGFETPVRLIDDVNPALAAHDTVVAVAAAERFQRVADFHGIIPNGQILSEIRYPLFGIALRRGRLIKDTPFACQCGRRGRLLA